MWLSTSVEATPTIENSDGEVVNYYFTEHADLTLTCKITAAEGEYTLAWLDNGMYNVVFLRYQIVTIYI